MVDELARLLEEHCDALVRAERESRERTAWPARREKREEEVPAERHVWKAEQPAARSAAADDGASVSAPNRAAEGGKEAEAREEDPAHSAEEKQNSPAQTETVEAAETLPLLLQTKRMEAIRAQMEQGTPAVQARLAAREAESWTAQNKGADLASAGRIGRGGAARENGWTANFLPGAESRRNAAERQERAETLGRLMQRDGRRYDSGFYLY